MPYVVLGLVALIAGGSAYTAHEIRGGIQDATRSPVAGVLAVAALGLTVYLIRRKVR